MEFKVLKHTCLLLLLIDLILFVFFNYQFCKNIPNLKSAFAYTEMEVYLTYLQVVIGLCFIIALIFFYMKEYKFSIMITFLHIIFLTISEYFWITIPRFDQRYFLSSFEVPEYYPFVYPYLYSLVNVIFGVLIYQKKVST